MAEIHSSVVLFHMPDGSVVRVGAAAWSADGASLKMLEEVPEVTLPGLRLQLKYEQNRMSTYFFVGLPKGIESSPRTGDFWEHVAGLFVHRTRLGSKVVGGSTLEEAIESRLRGD